MNVVVKTTISYILERVFNSNNNMNAKLSICLQCTCSSPWQFVLEGRYFFLCGICFVFFSTFWENKKKYGSGPDDHQRILLYGLMWARYFQPMPMVNWVKSSVRNDALVSFRQQLHEV